MLLLCGMGRGSGCWDDGHEPWIGPVRDARISGSLSLGTAPLANGTSFALCYLCKGSVRRDGQFSSCEGPIIKLGQTTG